MKARFESLSKSPVVLLARMAANSPYVNSADA